MILGFGLMRIGRKTGFEQDRKTISLDGLSYVK
jgi:hypothetical protein